LQLLSFAGFADESFQLLTSEINKLTSYHQKLAIENIVKGNFDEATKEINLAIDNNKNNEAMVRTTK
jgi:hypothetical protein